MLVDDEEKKRADAALGPVTPALSMVLFLVSL